VVLDQVGGVAEGVNEGCLHDRRMIYMVWF
jgi:hypothetical protein